MSSFALASLLLLAKAKTPAKPPSEGATRVLEQQCRTQAADPKNPWALAHGITAFGPSFKAGDGRDAIDVMLNDFARRDTKDHSRFSFAEFENGEPVEPHPNLIAKTLVLAGVPLSREVKRADGRMSVNELVQSVEGGFHSEVGDAWWAREAWTLDLLAQELKPGASTFKNDAGEGYDVAALEEAALAELEKQQAFLGEAMDQGKPSAPKERQLIYAHPCGGFHFIQGVLTWMRFPENRERFRARVDRQIAILFYRLGSETHVYDDALESSPKEYVLLLLAQKLKFYGHWLETVGRLEQEHTLVPSDEQKRQIAQAKELLAKTVEQLQEQKAFERMDEFRTLGKQLALDLIGDSCHAVHGLELTSGNRAPATKTH
jgi:hypothetical protein